MHKVIMCVSLLFSAVNLNSKEEAVIRSISFEIGRDNIVSLEIEVYSKIRDLIEMKVTFYNEEKLKISDDVFSSALSVEGKKTTIARIPFNEEEKMFFRLSFYSQNKKENIEDIYFPVYKAQSFVCDLSNENYCKGKIPKFVVYKNGMMEEKYEEIFLLNRKLKYTSFNNYLPLDKIKISSTFSVDGLSAYLILKERVEEINLYYKEEYKVPLSLIFNNSIISFQLSNNYYVNVIEGSTHEDYKEGTIFSNNILFPYKSKCYDMNIEIEDSVSFEKIIIPFNFETKGNLFGKCNESKYCVRRKYI